MRRFLLSLLSPRGRISRWDFWWWRQLLAALLYPCCRGSRPCSATP